MHVWCFFRKQMFQTKNFIGSLWILLLSFQRLEGKIIVAFTFAEYNATF